MRKTKFYYIDLLVEKFAELSSRIEELVSKNDVLTKANFELDKQCTTLKAQLDKEEKEKPEKIEDELITDNEKDKAVETFRSVDQLDRISHVTNHLNGLGHAANEITERLLSMFTLQGLIEENNLQKDEIYSLEEGRAQLRFYWNISKMDLESANKKIDELENQLKEINEANDIARSVLIKDNKELAEKNEILNSEKELETLNELYKRLSEEK